MLIKLGLIIIILEKICYMLHDNTLNEINNIYYIGIFPCIQKEFINETILNLNLDKIYQ